MDFIIRDINKTTNSTSYSSGGISYSGGAGSGLIKTVYSYSNINDLFTDTDLTSTFNAYTINILNNRLVTVENKNYLAGLTSTLITNTLGYTPYSNTNPNGYITSSSLNNYLPLIGGTLTGNLTINSTTEAEFDNNKGSIYTLGGITSKKSVQCLSLYSQSDIYTDGSINLGGSVNAYGTITANGGTMNGILTMNDNFLYVNTLAHNNGKIILGDGLHLDSFNGKEIILQYYHQGTNIQAYGNLLMNLYNITGVNSITANTITLNGDVLSNGKFTGSGSGLYGTASSLRVDGSSKLWCSNYPNDYYLTHSFDGTYFQLTSNYNKVVNVGHSNYSDYATSAGSVSSVSSSTIISGLGYTPYSNTNPNGYITSSSLYTKTSQLTNDSGFITSSSLPTNNNQLSNGSGYITSSALSPYQLISTAINTSNIGSQSVNYANSVGYVYNESANMRFHYSGQGGQPTWLWGGNSTDVYVYNPSNFSVNYANSAGSTGYLTTSLSGTNTANLIYAQIADNDYFRLNVGGTASNAGYVEFATADDGTEPIYFSQYTGVFSSLTRRLTLLDGAGNTSIPCQLTVNSTTQAQYDNNIGAVLVQGGIVAKKDVQCLSLYSKTNIYTDTNVDIGGTFNGSGAGLTGTAPNLSVNYATYANSLNNSYAHTNGSDGWWRSSGSAGWYNESYALGIYATDNTYVRTYNGAGFVANRIISNNYFKTTTGVALAGDYDTAGTTDKIIWTIGDSWTSLSNFYGLGYTYNNVAGFGHSLCMANAGTKMINFSLEYGSAKFVGNVTAAQFNGSGAGLTGINYATTAGSAPASDVYSWAKQSTKPSYSYNEVGAQAPITVTTNNTSGAATFSGNVLNIPNYSVAATSYDSAHSFATAGYQKLSNGMIMQWGTNAANSNVTFPIAFPNAVLTIHGANISSNNTEAFSFTSITKTGFYFNNYGKTNTGMWFAIGY